MSWGACFFYYRCPDCGRKFKYATDLIAEGALAIGEEMTLDEIISTIHSHPTVTEAMREAALQAEKRAIHTGNK